MANRKLQLAAVTVWAMLIGIGMSAIDRYDNRPGPKEPVSRLWPSGTRLALSPRHLTVVVFVHPECSCSAATLTEMEGLLARHSGSIDATLVAVIPAARTGQWEHSSLLQRAVTIAGLKLFYDYAGVEARRFGALTSGYSLAYSSRGDLQFAGGLTAARGEAGSNFGIETLAQLATNNPATRRVTPVFGCGLRNPSNLGRSK